MKGNKTTHEDLALLIFELMRLVKRQWSTDMQGVTSYLHLETLRFIKEAKDPDMGDVAQYLHIAPPSATALVTALVKDGLLLRKDDPSDRRKVKLAVSAKGERALTDAASCRAEAFMRVLAPLSAEDRNEFARILSVIIKQHS